MALTAVTRVTDGALVEALRSRRWLDLTPDTACPAVVVDLSERTTPADLDDLVAGLRSVPLVTIGTGPPDAPTAALADVLVADDGQVGDVLDTVRANPRASSALAVLLRGSEERAVGDGLAAESAVYSLLQAGPEFEAWRSSHPVRTREDRDLAAVRIDRTDDELSIVLARPHVHNAFSARMRDDLLDALELAAIDDSIHRVVLSGEGPSFCSGGDLDEFGTFPDPATAHLVRLTRSVGRAIAALSDRVTARIHGACMGSGIELPAFAGRVVAAPDTRIGLPEIGMGLVPGAGGTVSLPGRIGRQRTAWLALSSATIDAGTAHAWGLVDELEGRR